MDHAYLIWMILMMLCCYDKIYGQQILPNTRECAPSCCGNETIENYSQRNLQEIPPNLKSSMTELDLSRNNITEIKTGLYNLACLVKLDLSENRIGFIDGEAFRDLVNLQYLTIRKNRLNFNLTSPQIFAELTNLKVLDISYNFMWKSIRLYPDYLFATLSKLKTLFMDGIDGNVDLGPGFGALVSLESLYIHGRLTMVTNTTLANLSELFLRALYLQSGVLETIESFAFSHLPHLEILDLSFNPRLGLRNASQSWPGLNYTNITSLILKQASPFATEIIRVECSFFWGLENTNLKKLVLDGNNIVTVAALFSTYTPHLEYLSLSGNRIVMIHSLIQDISNMTDLYYLDVSHQLRRTFISETELVALFGNEDLDLFPLGGPQTTTVNQDPCSSSAPVPVPGQEWYIHVPKNLRFLNFTETITLNLDRLPTTIFYLKGNKLEYVGYSGNGMKHIDGTVVFRNGTKFGLTLDLSRNGCTNISGLFLAESTKTLILRDNKINEYLEEPAAKETFSDLRHVQNLDMSDNLIKTIPGELLENMTTLRTLNLSYNAISELSIDFTSKSELYDFDISYNLLSTITDKSQSQLLDIAKARYNSSSNQAMPVLRINLVGNPFVCGCSDRSFLRWLTSNNSINFENFNEYTCHYKSERRRANDGGFEKLLNDLDKDCNRNLIIILATVLPVVLAAIVALSVLAKRHIWDIRFCCIDFVIKRKKARQNELDCTHVYKYDAFVAYCEQDVMWVKNQMIPNVEDALIGSLKLCVHHRDFLPGPTIEENIVESIRQSRKTILVVSKQFLKSNWCHFELQMARAESFDSGRDVVITILLDPINPSTQGLSPTLMNILRKRTYLIWSNDVSQQDVFWKRVRNAIHSSSQKPTRCQCGRVMFHRGMMYSPDGNANRLPRTESLESDWMP